MGKFLSLLPGLIIFAALSSSSHYQLQSFSVNSGGTNSAASTNHKLFATTGEQSAPFSQGTNFAARPGLAVDIGVPEPKTPTLYNGGDNYYNKLLVTLDNTGEPSDVTYAIGIDTDFSYNFTGYIQPDGSVGPTPYYQSYIAWGGSSGTMIVNLAPNTPYTVAVLAKQSTFGAPIEVSNSASTITVTPALSFSLSQNLVTLGSLNAGSVVSDSSVTGNYITNGYNGGYVYMAGTSVGLVSSVNSNYTIKVNPPNGDLSSLSEGFGVQSASAAGGITAQSPYNGSSNTVGTVYTSLVPIYSASAPITNGTFGLALKAKASTTTPAGSDYTVTLTFIAAGNY